MKSEVPFYNDRKIVLKINQQPPLCSNLNREIYERSKKGILSADKN